MGQSYCKHVVVKYSETGHSGAGWYVYDAAHPLNDSWCFGHEPTAADLRGRYCDCEHRVIAQDALLAALRSVDPQTLPEHIAKLVADWKSS